jgi:hypothetical protein
MRGASRGVFGAHGLCSGRTTARAGMTHRCGSNQVCDGKGRLALCSCYVLDFRRLCQQKFLKFMIAIPSEKQNDRA